MKKLVLLFSLVGLLLVSGCKESSRAYVRLIAAEGGNGSAVVLSPGILLTAKHVAEADLNLFIEPEHIPVKIIRVSKDHDLALVSAPGINCPCASLAVLPPSMDEEVTVVGYPLNSSVRLQILTKGFIQGTVDNLYISTALVTFGNSGGGAFINDKLVGILVGIAAQSMGYMTVPVNYINTIVSWETIKEFLGPDV